MKQIYFHRAIFLSWYCSRGDCKFCYMSTQKDRIKNPKLARRTRESVLAEAILCKLYDWKIEFLSGGYESYRFDELVSLVKDITEAYGDKVWLNIGVLNKEELKQLKPYIKGVSGAVECITPKLRDEICPSKPLKEIEEMFRNAEALQIDKSITIVLGLGEEISDFVYLKEFIFKHKIKRVTFYRLKPQKGTFFENAEPIASDYYEGWISKTRKEFPELEIIAGSWITHLDEITGLVKAGAEGITKFPAIKLFNSRYASKLKEAVEESGAKFASNLTESKDFSQIIRRTRIDEGIRQKVIEKISEYSSEMSKMSKR